MLKRAKSITIATLLPLTMAAETVVTGKHVTVDAPASSGLDAIYVMADAAACSIVYHAGSREVKFFRFSDSGTAASTEFHPEAEGDTYTFKPAETDCGYMITDGRKRSCFYTVNYRNHELRLQNLTVDSDNSDCERTALTLDGKAGPIYYYSVNARRMELSRELKLKYTTLQVSDDGEFIPAEQTVTIAGCDGKIFAGAPLCATCFTLEGDRFSSVWGTAQRVESTSVNPQAVKAITSALRQGESSDSGTESDSAPAVITFKAALSDAAIFHEWQISDDPEFDKIRVSYSDPETTVTFDRAGTSFVRFEAANADGSCRFYSETYEVSIGESSITCPNAFSPGSSPGVNDEWRVKYKSITSFRCEIVNRWGVKVATLTHPSQGWDGKKNGKPVAAGVYYYVIKAEGADGRKYNLSGDINILNSKY